MKNTKGNVLITIIIVILIVIVLSGIGFGVYKICFDSKQTINNTEFIEGVEISNNAQEDDTLNTIDNDVTAPIIKEPDENAIPSETVAARYYYNQLDVYGKAIYDKLKQNKEQLITGTYVFNFGTNFNTLLHTEQGAETLNKSFQSAWNAFSYDEAGLFYIDIKKMNLINESRTLGGITTYYISIGPGDNKNYLQDNFQTKESIEKAQKFIDNIVRQIVQQTKNDNNVKRVKKVHNWMIEAMEYDSSEISANKYDIYGAIHDKKAVCEGYARSFKYIMERIGVPCVLVSGTAQNQEGDLEPHAWNYVQIENQWYAVDVTWDDPVITGGGTLTDQERYRFFLKGSDEFFVDHTQSGELSENSMRFSLPILSTTNYENY